MLLQDMILEPVLISSRGVEETKKRVINFDLVDLSLIHI